MYYNTVIFLCHFNPNLCLLTGEAVDMRPRELREEIQAEGVPRCAQENTCQT